MTGQGVVRFVVFVAVLAAGCFGAVALPEYAIPLHVPPSPGLSTATVVPNQRAAVGVGPRTVHSILSACHSVSAPASAGSQESCATPYTPHSKFGLDASTARPS